MTGKLQSSIKLSPKNRPRQRSANFKLESEFQKFVLKELNKIGVFFKKEALAIRGLPDLLGVANGCFVGLELKRSKKEAHKKTGRIVLQRHWLEKFENEKGFARLVHPESWNTIYLELCEHCKIDPLEESILIHPRKNLS